MVLDIQSEPVSHPLRDTVRSVPAGKSELPAIVSISDIHGYVTEARSALSTLSDLPEYEPVVTTDEDGRLHWADENYVLVFNGDLIDRGPNNDAVLAMVRRLVDEAPPGRIRITLGNHESMILMSNDHKFVNWYSTNLDTDSRKRFLQRICDGHVIAAYDGYRHTYAHAGASKKYIASNMNESLVEAAEQLYPVVGTMEESQMQSQLRTEYHRIFGKGDRHVKGPSAGLLWLEYDHLSTESPPQIVGHTPHLTPHSKGNTHCQDLILENRDSAGGEGVFLETPESLTALIREPSGEVATTHLE